MTDPTPPFMGSWLTDMREPSKWRFRTHQLRRLFDGQVHMFRPGVDYPPWVAVEDVVRKLQGAAYHRKVTLDVTVAPGETGIWIRSHSNLTGFRTEENLLMRQYEELLEENRLLRQKGNE